MGIIQINGESLKFLLGGGKICKQFSFLAQIFFDIRRVSQVQHKKLMKYEQEREREKNKI